MWLRAQRLPGVAFRRRPGSISVEPKNTLDGAPAIAESLVFVADAIRLHISEIATHQWRASIGTWARGCLSDAVRAIPGPLD